MVATLAPGSGTRGSKLPSLEKPLPTSPCRSIVSLGLYAHDLWGLSAWWGYACPFLVVRVTNLWSSWSWTLALELGEPHGLCSQGYLHGSFKKIFFIFSID